jgi:N-acetylglucosamine kinase-like BadF-type ATPase
MGADYFLGIDGGGTKTVCLVADGQGRILGSGIGGAANTNFTTVGEARAALREAVAGAWRQAGPPDCPPRSVILTGPAPTDLAEEVAIQETGAAGLIHAGEGEGAWYAALAFRGYDCGLAVDAGTGAMAWGFDRQGRQAYASAWGSLLGDEGGGYWIGMEAMRAVARAEDGREPPTALRAALLRALQLDKPWDMVALLYQRGMKRHEVAALSPIVASVAREGDVLARGFAPPIYMSGNLDGGSAHNQRMLEAYKDRIFYM